MGALRRLPLRLRRSLRARIVASLVLACAVTLAAATIVLLVPLEHRLRSGELAYLRTSAAHAASAFLLETKDREPRPSPGDSQLLAKQIGRLTRTRVLLVDTHGHRLADTDRDVPVPLALVQAAADEQRMVTSLVSHGRSTVARVALPVLGTKLVVVLEEPLRVGRTARTVRSGLWIAIVIALVTAIALGLVIGSGLSRRLRRLRDGALRVAERGIDEDLPRDGIPDEIGDLANAFELMQVHLRRQEEARRAFVGTSSHELRTPLTTLNGNLELLEQELSAPEPDLASLRDEARRARVQAQRLSGLATDLLELSRLDAGVAPTLLPTDISGTCRAVLAEFAIRAERQGVTLELELHGERSIVLADSNGIAQILRILIDNGLRFSPPGSSLEVTIDSTDAQAIVRVRDEGPGVPQEERELIFERFRRGAVTGGESGFGLGLAIGRELAERMGGTLRLSDGGPPGAVFELRLPTTVEPGESPWPSSLPSPGSPEPARDVQPTRS